MTIPIRKRYNHCHRRFQSRACDERKGAHRLVRWFFVSMELSPVLMFEDLRPAPERPMRFVPGDWWTKSMRVLLTGGSAFGLDAAGGVMQFLEERGVGFPTGAVRVPIVPSAVIFDLGVGDSKVRPDREMGYHACVNATNARIRARTGGCWSRRNGWEGTRTSVVEWRCRIGMSRLMKSGLMVGAIVIVNAVGNVVDPTTGKIIAGAKDPETGEFVNITERLSEPGKNDQFQAPNTNTTIGVVGTNAALSPTEVTKVAQMAHNGLARTIHPVHTLFDGDTIFALSTRNP